MKRCLKLYCIIGILCIVLNGCEYFNEDTAIDHTLEKQSEDVSIQEDEVEIQAEASDAEEQTPDTESDSVEPVIVPVEKTVFVKVQDYIPEIFVDLKYHTTDNFTGQKIYEFCDAYLRYGTVEKLMKVQGALEEQGLSLKIWDAYRPTDAQFVLWEICPDATYVANPNQGFSSHSRGNTVDVTIVDQDGNELVMPTGFDDFSTLADRDYSDCSEEAAANADMLEQLMQEYGFKPYYGEWWHFSDLEEYPVEEEFLNSNDES